MWTVTRQCQWPNGIKMVEISAGGLDYTNPGAYSPKYDGEMKTYLNAREAVEVAIRISKSWQSDELDSSITIGCGGTGGMTMPFDSCTFEEARKWASNQKED